MPKKIGKLLVLLCLSMVTTGCASIVSDNNSATYIQTEPEEARCELHGQDFKRVINTPTSISLPSEAAPITVACKADGYRTTTEKLDTSMDGWVFGNLLFGGIIGVAVDAARGAGQKYPSQLTIVLEPERFASTSERDEYYANRRKDLEERLNKAVQAVRNSCKDDEGSSCRDRVAKAEAERDKHLADLDARRVSSKVKK